MVCVQSVHAAGVGCSLRVSFFAAFLSFSRLRIYLKHKNIKTTNIFVVDIFKQLPAFAYDSNKHV